MRLTWATPTICRRPTNRLSTLQKLLLKLPLSNLGLDSFLRDITCQSLCIKVNFSCHSAKYQMSDFPGMSNGRCRHHRQSFVSHLLAALFRAPVFHSLASTAKCLGLSTTAANSSKGLNVNKARLKQLDTDGKPEHIFSRLIWIHLITFSFPLACTTVNFVGLLSLP